MTAKELRQEWRGKGERDSSEGGGGGRPKTAERGATAVEG
jgi:hypothetical protein